MTPNGLDVKFATSLDFLAQHGNKLLRLNNFVNWLKKELDFNEFLLRDLGTLDEFFNIEIEIVYRGKSLPLMRLMCLWNILNTNFEQQVMFVSIEKQSYNYVLKVKTI